MTSSTEPQVMSRLRVVHLVAPAPVGGAESVVRTLASGRRRYSGHAEVLALVADSGPEVFLQQLRASGIPTMEVREGRRRYHAQVRAVARLLTSTGADLIHTHVYHADFVGYLAARRCGLPAVATYHGHVGGSLKNSLYEWFDRRLLRRFDAVICVSRHNRDRLIHTGCDPTRLHLVENGVDVGVALSREAARHSLGVPEASLAIGWVGRLSHEKGPDLLLQALPHLQLPGVATVLVGAGPERPRLQALIRDLGLESVVSLAGQKPDAASLFRAFDVLVSSSRTEGLPIILLEAMALRVPLVAFVIGGIPEILTDASARLVQPGDVRGLAAAIREVLTNRDDANRRADRAYATIQERFSPKRWVDNVDQVYAAVLDSPHIFNAAARPDTIGANDTNTWLHELGVLAERAIGFAWRRGQYAVERRRSERVRRDPRPLIHKLRHARTILMVCHGNIVRSAFAAHYLARAVVKQKPVAIQSAGIAAIPGGPAHPHAISQAATFTLDLSHHVSATLSEEMVSAADVILVMELAHSVFMRRRFRGARSKIFLLCCLAPETRLEVADPFAKDEAAFAECFAHIVSALRPIIQVVREEDS